MPCHGFWGEDDDDDLLWRLLPGGNFINSPRLFMLEEEREEGGV